ncbi:MULTISPECIES: ChbG/HpnK family deacetylase [Acidobacteriaceae]|uniref:ChbG/HpnK family deacetylase n=1 Tax=Acidobacteriaceae TaxID=204434 RepID=UPI00131C46F0|nr:MULTISPECIES: ChbG/HpnK family deacetylase [Acidobacteriaceae]MDW5266205.1 ChbG/HpnK family deacetylase [Edaphobacter sp.]
MASRLIINADDFGLTLGVNRAIAELHQAHVLTSATLMATGAAFDDAIAIARANPSLGVGCHVVLTDGEPVSPPDSIPTLLGADGKNFRPSLFDFMQALIRGNIREEEIEREAVAQIQKLQRAGIAVTHLDTHKHTHLFPAVARPLLRVAQRCSIGAVRNPFEPAWSSRLAPNAFVRRLQFHILSILGKRSFESLPQLKDGHMLTADGTIGISATGQLDAISLHKILRAMPEGTWELVCHPGYNDAALNAITTRLRATREIERDALLQEIPQAIRTVSGLELIHYGQIGQPHLDYERPL